MKKLCLLLFALVTMFVTQAATVSISGNFNNWSSNDASTTVTSTNSEGFYVVENVKIGSGGFNVLVDGSWYKCSTTPTPGDTWYSMEAANQGNTGISGANANSCYNFEVDINNGVKVRITEFVEQGGEDPDPGYVFYLGGDPFGWNSDASKDDTYKKEANKLKYIGDDTYQITGVTIPANKYFSIYASANGSDFKQYNYSDRNISGTVDNPIALVSNNSAIQTSVDLTDVTFTLYVNGDGNYTLSITDPNQVVEPVITYEYVWAAKESDEKAFELVLSNGLYTLSNALSNVPQAFYLECTKKVYVDDVEDTAQTTTTVYGWTNHSGLEPNGEITLYKDNNPITFAEGYENFNLSFAHVEGTPDNVKINFTATKDEPVVLPEVVTLKYAGDLNNGNWEFHECTVEDGIAVFTQVPLSGGFNIRYRYDASTEDYYSMPNHSWAITSTPASFEESYKATAKAEKDGVWQTVDYVDKTKYYDITFNFNDLTYTIIEHVEQVDPSKVTTVYFIDRQNWGNLHCYNYSDKGLTSDGSGNVTNGKWPGKAMEDITENEKYENLIAGIQGMDNDERGYRVYKIDLTDTELDDENNYTLPKIIFAGGNDGNGGTTQQTYNLYLVNNGIYTNGTAKTVDGQIAIKASDYLPRQWYDPTAEKDEQCVFIYPNAEANTEYAYIYVDVAAYTDAYKDGEKVSVQVEVGEGDNKFIATGQSGTHYLSLVTINGKDYLRVAIAEDVVPAGTPVNLIVWIGEENVEGDVLSPQVAYDSKWTSCKHPDCTNDTDKTLHEDCPMDSRCPLIFTDVNFVNGALFTRSSEQDNIITMTIPTRMYLIDAEDNGAFDLAGLEDMKTVLGDDYIAYDVTSTLENGEYVIPNVPQKAKFYMLGAYDTDEEGEAATVYHIFSNNNNPLMLPGNNYPFRYDEKGTYSISDYFGTAREYTVFIHWADQVVSVRTEAKPNAFQLAQNRDGNAYVGVNYQIAHFLFAVADDDKTQDEIHIMHASEFDPDFHKENHSVTFAPTEDYEVFMKGSLNKEVGEGDYDEKLTNAETGATSTHSYLKARAYTAGIYTLNVSNEDADLITAASSDIPVRVIPTIESLGMNLNYLGIFDEATLNCSYAGDFVLNLGALPEAGTGFDEKDANGVTYRWDENRIGFFPTMADYIVNGKTADETLQIWWAYLDGSNVQTRAAREATVVSAYNGLTATANPFGTPAENGLKRFSYTNAMSAEGIKAAKGFKVQMVQNGIASPVYIFNATDQTGTTGVDELGVEEGEAVYYDLNGVKVDGTNLAKGIYVKVVGNKATKVFVK